MTAFDDVTALVAGTDHVPLRRAARAPNYLAGKAVAIVRAIDLMA